jgi:hypothetical protein
MWVPRHKDVLGVKKSMKRSVNLPRIPKHISGYSPYACDTIDSAHTNFT